MIVSPTRRLSPPRQLALPLALPPTRPVEVNSGPMLCPSQLWATLSSAEKEQIRQGVLRVLLEVMHERVVAEP